MAEVWRSIPDYEGFYEVSDLGRVRSCTRSVQSKNRGGPLEVTRQGKLKRPTPDKDGYLSVGLYKDGKQKRYRVSRLVLEAFDRPPQVGEEARHQNHDTQDNSLQNLTWGSRQDNEDDKSSSGRRPVSTRSVLSHEDVSKVRDLYATGKYTQRQVGEIVGCHHSNVSLIVRRETWR